MEKRNNADHLNPQYLIFFSTAAAVSAAIVAITAQSYLKRRAATVPDDLLARCQHAIETIERDLQSLT